METKDTLLYTMIVSGSGQDYDVCDIPIWNELIVYTDFTF